MTIELVSIATNGTLGDNLSDVGAPSAFVSADGRYVVFKSRATNLDSGDTNGSTQDIFLRDRQTGTTTLLTSGANSDSFDATISGNGRYVVYTSYASNITSGDTNGLTYSDIYVHDLQTSTTKLITPGENNYSFLPSISADGRYIVFHSQATNLTATDPNGSTNDILLYDQQTQLMTNITLGGNSGSSFSSLSADGRYIAFASAASNLVAGDTNNRQDIFVYDQVTATTSIIAPGGNDHAAAPTISADGRYVAYHSYSSNLAPGDTNGQTYADIYVLDRATGAIKLITAGGNNNSLFASISDDGRFIAFQSDASNLVAGDTNGQRDIFVYDRLAGTTTLVTPGGNSTSSFPSISADGATIAFESSAENLAPGDSNSWYDVLAAELSAAPAANTSDSVIRVISP